MNFNELVRSHAFIRCLLLADLLLRVNSQLTTTATTTITTRAATATTIPTQSTQPTTIATSSTLVPCGNTQKMVDECFKELPPHLMEFLQTTKIVIKEQEIISKCTVFHRGMRCFETYTARCLSDRKKHLFKNNVEGARKFFQKFCGDRDFQKVYLQHKDCFGYIQDDWAKCTRNFQEILTEELSSERTNITDKFMEFCCARHAYENCIYTSARYKCYRSSAKFARDTAKMLSDEKHFSNCRQYEVSLCTTGTAAARVTQAAAGWDALWRLVGAPALSLLMLRLLRR